MGDQEVKIEPVYVTLASPPGPGPTDGAFLEMENERGESVAVVGREHQRTTNGAVVYRIGPLVDAVLAADALFEIEKMVTHNDVVALKSEIFKLRMRIDPTVGRQV